MKKILFILTFLLISALSFSQSTLYTYYFMKGEYNSYTEKWRYYNQKELVLKITFYPDVVYVGDAANSRYKIINLYYKDAKLTCWNAVDETYKRCKIKISTNDDGESLFTVYYGDDCFVYFLYKNE